MSTLICFRPAETHFLCQWVSYQCMFDNESQLERAGALFIEITTKREVTH